MPPDQPWRADEATFVERSQAEWRAVRQRVNRTRTALTRTAVGLYRADTRLGSGPLLARPNWIPDTPVRLDSVRLEWTDEVPAAPVTGGEPEAGHVLPLRAPGQRFARYTAAIHRLDPPALFENRPSYRLLDADFSAPAGRLRFGLAAYFDKLDLCEAVAHELGLVSAGADTAPPWSRLPLRALVGDPFDLHRRCVIPDIQTLTLRRDRLTGTASFLLLRRDPTKVATAGGSCGLIPTGEFQPTSDARRDRENDFDLWRNIVREYAEEVLGQPERAGRSGEPLDYEQWDLHQTLCRARDAGRMSVHCLGVGLDPLTLAATVLTVAVFDDDVFDEVFNAAVRVNAEGALVTATASPSVPPGLSFTEETIRRLLRHEPITAPGACLLGQAWRFRDIILAR